MKMVLQACLIMLIGSVQYTYSMEGPTAETASEGFLGVLPDDLRNLLNKYLESAGTLDEAVRNVGSIMVLGKGNPDELMKQVITGLARKFETSKEKVADALERAKSVISPAVQKWLDRNAQLEKELFVAFQNDDVNKIRQLIKKGVDVRAYDQTGSSVFGVRVYSILPTEPEIVRVLLEAGAKPTQEEWAGLVRSVATTPTWAYGAYKDREALKLVNQQFRMDPNVRDVKGETILTRLIKEMVRRHMFDTARETLLMLLQMGANPTIRDNTGRNAIDYARHLGFPNDFIEILVKAGRAPIVRVDQPEKEERLRQEAAVGNDEAIVRLLQEGVNINAQDKTGETALVKAIKTGRIEIVRLLLDRGASKSIKTHGMTPYKLALRLGYHDIASLLQ